MGPLKRFFKTVRKPEGWLGEVMVRGMNAGHSAVASWGSQFVDALPSARILDVGCGGGANIRSYLMSCDGGRVDGAGYSEASVAAARALNSRAVADGLCRIERASADDLPFADDSYDLAIEFETVYFWSDPVASFREVLRVLRPGGRLMVVNELVGGTARAEWFERMAGPYGLSVFSDEQLMRFMSEAGFAGMTVFRHTFEPWVCVVGTKPASKPATGLAAEPGSSTSVESVAGGEPKTRLRDEGPDYRNWIPRGMVMGLTGGATALAAGAVASHRLRAPRPLSLGLVGVAAGCGAFALWCAMARERFSYSGARKLSRQIVEGTAAHVRVPAGGTCLDVGCGSGALSIAVARRNPAAEVVGGRSLGGGVRVVQQGPLREKRQGRGRDQRNLPSGRRDRTAI